MVYKQSMQSCFTSYQLVFLADLEGFVPCILAIREDCVLGKCVTLKTALGLASLDLAPTARFLFSFFLVLVLF